MRFEVNVEAAVGEVFRIVGLFYGVDIVEELLPVAGGDGLAGGPELRIGEAAPLLLIVFAVEGTWALVGGAIEGGSAVDCAVARGGAVARVARIIGRTDRDRSLMAGVLVTEGRAFSGIGGGAVV